MPSNSIHSFVYYWLTERGINSPLYVIKFFVQDIHLGNIISKIHQLIILGTHALEMAAAIAEQSGTTDGSVAPVKEIQDYEEVIEDLSVSDPEADSSHYMAILVECLSMLNKIPEAVKVCT